MILIAAFIYCLRVNWGWKMQLILDNDNLFASDNKKLREIRKQISSFVQRKKLQEIFHREIKSCAKIAENLDATIKLLKVEKLCKFLQSASDKNWNFHLVLNTRATFQLLNIFINDGFFALVYRLLHLFLWSMKWKIFKAFVIRQLLWLRRD